MPNGSAGLGGFSGTMTYSINGGSNHAIDTLVTGVSSFDVGPNDMIVYHFGVLPGANVGDVVLLNSGTLTTNFNVSSAPPPDGSFNTLITDGNGHTSSTFGVAIPVPESRSIALFISGGLGLLLLKRNWRRTAKPPPF